MERLASALAALEGGQSLAALEALLDAWRTTRSPQVAELIDQLSAVNRRSLPPIVAKTRNAFHERWLDLANAQRACDVDRLAAGMTNPPWTLLRERIDRLTQRPDDPRLALALARFVLALPTTNTPGTACWNAIFRLIARTADLRTLAPLEARLAMPPVTGLFQTDVLVPGIEKVRAALAEVKPEPVDEALLVLLSVRIARLAEQPAPAEAALLATAAPPADAPNEEELLRRVYAAPDDDAPRLVYADFLAERGDPRGEFIALQFKPKPTGNEQKRLKALLREHGRAWMRELEPAVQAKTEEFSRGFLSSCRPTFRTAAQRKALSGHPAWNTITTLTTWGEADHEFLLDTELKGLRRLEASVPIAVAAKMAGRTPPYPRLAAMTVIITGVTREQQATFAAAGSLPSLVDLVVTGSWNGHREAQDVATVPGFAWLLHSPLGERLETLKLTHLNANLLEWLPAVAAQPRLKQFDVDAWPPLSFLREGDGWRARVGRGYGVDASGTVLAPLRSLVHTVELLPAMVNQEQYRQKLLAQLQGFTIVEAAK